MTDAPQKAAPPPPEPEPDEPALGGTPAGRLLFQLFLVPAFIVLVAVFVFWLFGSMAIDKKGASELLTEVKSGSRNQRWQAAFELTRRLPAPGDPVARAAFAEEVVRVFEGAERDDPRVRRYLALLLGRLGDPKAVPLLTRALNDADAETRLYALWGLALIGDPSSAPAARPFLESEDAGMRKTAAYAAGRLVDAESIPALKRLLGDAVIDVRWNAALALATLEDASGHDVLVAMTDRKQLGQVPGLTADQQDEALLNGVRGLLLLEDPAARPLAERLQSTDPSLRVRREVGKILKPEPKPGP